MEIIQTLRVPGPNRRSDCSILEYELGFRPGFADLPVADDAALQKAIHSFKDASVGLPRAGVMPEPDARASWPTRISQQFASLALWLQQEAGHAVSACGVNPDSEDPVIWVWFEYDHLEVGERAATLALAVIRTALGLGIDSQEPVATLQQQWQGFSDFAQGKALSPETRALVAAAERREVPCFKLDRYPYDPFVGDFRIRPNGLLRLGHARHQYVLDGTLCVNWNPAQVARMQHRPSMLAALRAVGIPVNDQAGTGCLRVLVIGGKLVAAARDGEVIDQADIPDRTGQHVDVLHRSCKLPIFAATITSGGAWTQLELAPDLASWFPAGGAGLEGAADLLLDQLYPPGRQYRIPIVSVTGTNGKTTTCTMLKNILLQSGKTPVTVCSNGVYLGDQSQGSRRDMGSAASWYALESKEADVAVMEDYFGSICRFGFAYEWSDVAVCTNVTVDHLHRIGIHTLEQMAEVKFAVIGRARKGAVLNADNPYCAAMLARAGAEKRLAVSMLRDRPELAAEHPCIEQFCVLEREGGRDFITLYDGGSRLLLMAVDDIPATWRGQAKHNVSNAMHAAGAAWILGVKPADIAAALRAFASDFNTCRGRLNEFTGLPFRVIMDYAHNADGFRQVSAFIDAQQVRGRKFISFNFSEDRRHSEIQQAVGELAGHFDFYTCGKFRESRLGVTSDIQAALHGALLEFGVSPDAITLAANSSAAISHVLGQARPGDLVVLLVGSSEFEGLWQNLEVMRSGVVTQPGSSADSPPVALT